MNQWDIPSYSDYVSPNLHAYLRHQLRPVDGVPGLFEVGAGGGLETPEALRFVCELYEELKRPLCHILEQRVLDRAFLDSRTRACAELNRKLGIDFLDPRYQTVLGQEDSEGRIVVGPKSRFFSRAGYGKPIAPLPEKLQGAHVTLFGPPDDPKLSINAMNAFHRKLKDEPAIVGDLLASSPDFPKWGADDEDSKTPLRGDLVSAGMNLTGCFESTLRVIDDRSGKRYELEKTRLSLPIKRFPGLALPSTFLFYQGNPLPLHLYDFALHLHRHWRREEALSFYVPKLETEEEAAYIASMVAAAERKIKEQHPEYRLGSVRLFIVLENPRAIFRVNEIMDALHPYFAGASLGWHDYLSSTARLFKEDPNYRIPVKADPDIVIKYIKASHELLASVVGSRGGVKIGGMYGVLPTDQDLKSDSFQITMKGFIKDVVTQMKRNLSGFWVAHPDFVRIGIALVEAWRHHAAGDPSKLKTLVTSLMEPRFHDEILRFIQGEDASGLDIDDPLYPRSLLVADIKESSFIANNHPEEIRYNVFQSLQYLTDWLSGNGCVALPAQIEEVPVRVMDDLATAERSRWEVWHELHHGRFALEDFLRIAHEEMRFIRKDLSDEKKIVQVKWNERTEKWYPIAFKLMLLLMANEKPPEFASELLLPFTIDSIRNSDDPWKTIREVDPEKYEMPSFVERYCEAFEICGSRKFASAMSSDLVPDLEKAEKLIRSFDLSDIIEAASFHGNIGEEKKTLDIRAAGEQALVLQESLEVKEQLRDFGDAYLKKFGVKFLISAQGRSGPDLLQTLKIRLNNSLSQELDNAREALWQITLKRYSASRFHDIRPSLQALLDKHRVPGAQIAVSQAGARIQTFCLGRRDNLGGRVGPKTLFEVASLSKTLGSCFAIEYFLSKGIPLDSRVNMLLERSGSPYRIPSLDPAHPEWGDQVTLAHLMSHEALNMHYVKGFPLGRLMPGAGALLNDPLAHGYEKVGVLNKPGTVFRYSGGGFLVLEHLIESLEGRGIQELTKSFFADVGTPNLTFDQKSAAESASGFSTDGVQLTEGRKMFPAFAAGALGTAADVSLFLESLAKAFHDPDGAAGISHDTAVLMLHGVNRSSRSFMGADMGLGIFVAEAGPNRLLLHQGANDGYRALFVHCASGPDRGKGFTILCNGDVNGVSFVAEVARLLLKELRLQGIDLSGPDRSFDPTKNKPEEVVNLAYKDLVFSCFLPDLPEEIVAPGSLDPLAARNLAVGGKILEVTNQKFARASNLLSPKLPVFDPTLFGRQGKIMDSWESARHNPRPCDELVFEMKKPSSVSFVSLSTQFHLGNQASSVMIEGHDDAGAWKVLVPKIELEGHSVKRVRSADPRTVFSRIRVSMYPDGGLSRLGLFSSDLPAEEQERFLPWDQARSEKFQDAILTPRKPLAPKFDPSEEDVRRNLASLKPGQEFDVACSAFGGRIISASNEHYGPAAQIISPYPPLHMFDGFESARSREAGHFEQVTIALGKTALLHRIEVDFQYFRNNNPSEMRIEGLSGGAWVELVPRRTVKPYAGNLIRFELKFADSIEQLRLTVFPDGGLNRVRALARA